MSYNVDSDSDELFSNVSTIDIKRKKKITIKLQDKEGGDLELKEVVDDINRYITDQLKRDEDNKLRDEVFPLVTQVCMSGLTYAMGSTAGGAFVASQELLRSGTSHLMMLSFYFLKFLQKHEIKVLTEEEDVTDEEIEKMIRISRAAGTATLASMMGMPMKEIIAGMLENGDLTREDIKSFDLGDTDELASEAGDKKEVSGEGSSSEKTNSKDSKTDPKAN